MSLFGESRDVLFVNSINEELLSGIISQQVGYYKVDLNSSTTNIYGESINKFIYDPVLVYCLITRGKQTWFTGEEGPNVIRESTFAFFKNELIEKNIIPEVGDYIVDQESYYEVDTVVENQYFVGKDPNYSYSEVTENYGTSISIICTAHNIPADRLGITLER